LISRSRQSLALALVADARAGCVHETVERRERRRERRSGVDLELESTARGFEDLAGDEYVGKFDALRYHTHGTPLTGAFESRLESTGEQA